MPYVYGIQCGEFVKIGSATKVGDRVKTMRLYNPHPVKVILRRECYRPLILEKRIHALLKPFAAGREWFAVTPRQAREACTQAFNETWGLMMEQHKLKLAMAGKSREFACDR